MTPSAHFLLTWGHIPSLSLGLILPLGTEPAPGVEAGFQGCLQNPQSLCGPTVSAAGFTLAVSDTWWFPVSTCRAAGSSMKPRLSGPRVPLWVPWSPLTLGSLGPPGTTLEWDQGALPFPGPLSCPPPQARGPCCPPNFCEPLQFSRSPLLRRGSGLRKHKPRVWQAPWSALCSVPALRP